MKSKNSKIKVLWLFLSILMSMLLLLGCTEDVGGKKNDTANSDKKITYSTITTAKGKSMIDAGGIILVDVRTKSEFDDGHILGAILLPNETIEKEVTKDIPDLNATIVLYCRSGNRSAQAAKKLINLGYENVYDMGGINSWISDGYDIVK